MAAGDGQLHVTIDVGIVSTAEHQRNPLSRLTSHDNLQVAIHVGILTGADQFTYVQETGVARNVLPDVDSHASSNRSLLVTATVGLVHGTAINHGVGIAVDIGTGVDFPFSIVLVLILTVTATKQGTNLEAAIHIHLRLRNRSSITAAIDRLDAGQVTSVDVDMRLHARRLVWCQVTTAIDGGKLVGGIVLVSRFGLHRPLCIKAYRFPDRHRHVTLRRPHQVVTAEHAAALGHIGITLF